ncbi:MAG: hypothetical protein JXB38_19460 [Anaerolineales bacterium]|nr:hypothetical protein [Anaerolineales bacterium]
MMNYDPEEYQKIVTVKDRYKDQLLKKANVVGVGVGRRKVTGELTNRLVLVVMVEKKVPVAQLDPQDVLPKELEGVSVDVQEMGKIKAQT